MNRDDFAMLCVSLVHNDMDAALHRMAAPWFSLETGINIALDAPASIVSRAKRIARHAKRLRTLTDERAIQRVLRKVEVLTGTPWEAETTDGVTYLVGPFFIPHD